MFKTIARTLLKSAVLLLAIIALGLPLVMWQSHHPHDHLPLVAIIAQNPLAFTLFRIAIIAGIWWLWPRFIRWRANKEGWPANKAAFWQQRRWVITSWLIIVELLIGQNLLVKAFNLI